MKSLPKNCLMNQDQSPDSRPYLQWPPRRNGARVRGLMTRLYRDTQQSRAMACEDVFILIYSYRRYRIRSIRQRHPTTDISVPTEEGTILPHRRARAYWIPIVAPMNSHPQLSSTQFHPIAASLPPSHFISGCSCPWPWPWCLAIPSRPVPSNFPHHL